MGAGRGGGVKRGEEVAPGGQLTSLTKFRGGRGARPTVKHALFPTAFMTYSVADPDPGSGAFLTPGSGIRDRFFADPGSRIPDPKTIFLRAF